MQGSERVSSGRVLGRELGRQRQSMSSTLARPLAAAAFAFQSAHAAFVDKGFGTFSCFDCECQSPPLPAFPPSPPPTCEDDGNPVQRLAAGAVAGAFAAAAIYGRAPTKRTRNVKTQTPPQPYVCLLYTSPSPRD